MSGSERPFLAVRGVYETRGDSETAKRVPISCTTFSRYSGNDEAMPIFVIARMAWLDGATQMDVFTISSWWR